MDTYSLTIRTLDNDMMMKMVSELAKYECNISIEKNAENKHYTFNYEETSYQRLGEKKGRTLEEFKEDQKFFDYISSVLKSYGLNDKYRGFRYIIECIRIMHIYADDVYSLGLDIYPIVSNWYKVSQSSVEHDIRNTISESWKNYQFEIDNGIKPSTKMTEFDKKPTNLKFLRHVSNITHSKIY